eukprot:TRINITY_DN2049_c0_g1_i1.p1 TRINITY_DN2049_c0_g1~~TRINITY_DN2049_c0_g1_i1.p1  ORF type:complete len:1062 (+),score=94.61 TRINITY_DN2049_c0_g1_i1:400-3585(+)
MQRTPTISLELSKTMKKSRNCFVDNMKLSNKFTQEAKGRTCFRFCTSICFQYQDKIQQRLGRTSFNANSETTSPLPLIETRKEKPGPPLSRKESIRLFLSPKANSKLPGDLYKPAVSDTKSSRPASARKSVPVTPEQVEQGGQEIPRMSRKKFQQVWSKLQKFVNRQKVERNLAKRLRFKLKRTVFPSPQKKMQPYKLIAESMRKDPKLRHCASLDTFVKYKLSLPSPAKLAISAKRMRKHQSIKAPVPIFNHKPVPAPIANLPDLTLVEEAFYKEKWTVEIKPEYYSRVKKRETLKQLKNSFRYEPPLNFSNDQYAAMGYEQGWIEIHKEKYKKHGEEWVGPWYSIGIVLWLGQCFITEKKEIFKKIEEIRSEIPVDHLYKHGDQIVDQDEYERLLYEEQEKTKKTKDISSDWYIRSSLEDLHLKHMEGCTKLLKKSPSKMLLSTVRCNHRKNHKRKPSGIHAVSPLISYKEPKKDLEVSELSDSEEEIERKYTSRYPSERKGPEIYQLDPRKNPEILKEIAKEIVGGEDIKSLNKSVEKELSATYSKSDSIKVALKLVPIMKRGKRIYYKDINLTLKEQNLKAAIRTNAERDERGEKCAERIKIIEKELLSRMSNEVIDKDAIEHFSKYGKTFQIDHDFLKERTEKSMLLRISKEFRTECTRKMDNFLDLVDTEGYNVDLDALRRQSFRYNQIEGPLDIRLMSEYNKAYIVTQERIEAPFIFDGCEKLDQKTPFKDIDADSQGSKSQSSDDESSESLISGSSSESDTEGSFKKSELKKVYNILYTRDKKEMLKYLMHKIQNNYRSDLPDLVSPTQERESTIEEEWPSLRTRRTSLFLGNSAFNFSSHISPSRKNTESIKQSPSPPSRISTTSIQREGTASPKSALKFRDSFKEAGGLVPIRERVPLPPMTVQEVPENIENNDREEEAPVIQTRNSDKLLQVGIQSAVTQKRYSIQPMYRSAAPQQVIKLSRMDTLTVKKKPSNKSEAPLARFGTLIPGKFTFNPIQFLSDKGLRNIRKMCRRTSTRSKNIRIDVSGRLFKAVREIRLNEVIFYRQNNLG